MNHDPDELLTREQVAEKLKVSTRTVTFYASVYGMLKPIRIGHRTVRFRRGDVDAFIESRKQKTK